MKKMFKITAAALAFTIVFSVCASADVADRLSEEMKNEIDYMDDVYQYDVPFMTQEEPEKEEEQAETLTHQKAADYMRALGLLTNAADGRFHEDNIVNRRELAEVAAMLYYGENTWGQAAEEDNGAATHLDAVKSVMGALGYVLEDDDENYLMKEAMRVRLLSGMSYAAEKHITRGELSRLIYNALDVDLMRPESVGSITKYTVREGETLLSERFHAIELKGLCTAAGGVDLYSNGAADERSIGIDGYAFRADGFHASPLLGYRVYGLARYDEDREYAVIMLEKEKEDNSLFLRMEDVTLGQNGLSYLDESGREQRVSLSGISHWVHNGTAVPDYRITDELLSAEGSILLAASERGGEYDIAVINEYRNFAVDRVTTMDDKLYFKYGLTLDALPYVDLKESREKTVEIIKNGEAVRVSDIKPSDAVSVYKGRGGSYVRVVVSDTKVSGTVDEVSGQKALIDGKEYPISAAYRQARELGAPLPEIVPGLGALLSISADGYIVDVSKLSDSFRYGILKGIDGDSGSSSVDDTVRLKVFTQEGTWEVLELAEKVTADRKNKLSSREVYSYLSPHQEALYCSIIRYRTNDAGEVTFLDTILGMPEEAGDTESLIETGRWNGANGVFKLDWRKGLNLRGSTYSLTTDALIFYIPEDTESEEDFRIYAQKDLIAESTVSFIFYNADDYFRSKLVVYTGSSAGGSFVNTEGFLVNDVVKALDKNGNEVYHLKGLQAVLSADNKGWQPVDYYTTANIRKNYPDIKKGDLLHYNLDTNGNIYQVKTLMTSEKAATDAEFNKEVGYDEVVLATVLSVNTEDGMIRIRCGAPQADAANEYSYEIRIAAIYDKSAGRAVNVSLSDVQPGDKIYLRGGYRMVNAVVYR